MMVMMVWIPKFWRILFLKRSTQIILELSQFVSAQKDISNGMWKSMNGYRDQNLLMVEVRIMKSLEVG